MARDVANRDVTNRDRTSRRLADQRCVRDGNDDMDQAIKETLLERLRAYLEQLDAADAPEGDVSPTADATEMVADLESDAVTDEARDLFSVFVEIAATRNEVRTQSRIVKDALDRELITVPELESVAHRQGFESLDEVHRCILEPGGTLAMFGKKPSTGALRQEELIDRLEEIKAMLSAHR